MLEEERTKNILQSNFISQLESEKKTLAEQVRMKDIMIRQLNRQLVKKKTKSANPAKEYANQRKEELLFNHASLFGVEVPRKKRQMSTKEKPCFFTGDGQQGKG